MLSTVAALPLAAAAQAPAPPRPLPVWCELGLNEVRHVLGMRIRNEQRREIGDIDNLLIDTQSGRISHVVIGVGGFMGVGERKIVVGQAYDDPLSAHATSKRPAAPMPPPMHMVQTT